MTEEEKNRISEIMEEESKAIFSKYVDPSRKNRVKKTTVSGAHDDDKKRDTTKPLEIKSIEPRSVVKIYLIVFLVLLSVTIYDLITLESKKTIPVLFLILFTFLTAVSFLLYRVVPVKNKVIFTLTKEGLLIKDRILNWDRVQTFEYLDKGYDYLIIKEIEEEELIVPLYSLRYFPDRVCSFIEIYKTAKK